MTLRLGAAPAALAICLLACGGARLTTIEHGGNGPPTLILLHGYGSSAEQWEPFTRTIRLPPPGRFIFPQAPGVTAPPAGPSTGRAWWPLELNSNIPAGHAVPDLSSTRPPGLEAAAATVTALLRNLSSRHDIPILGGYSQGAMVASEVAFRSDAPLSALVLLSGTLVDEASWQTGFHTRRGLPIFIAHGRSDPVLSFAIADRYRSKLQAVGGNVTWVPFDGEHEIPAQVVIALNQFLERLLKK